LSTYIDIKTNRNIPTVANYAALPAPNIAVGEYYWVLASQGTYWLPGNLGGTYYPLGLYFSNGAVWSHMETPVQATLSEVNIGTIEDKFVSPSTLLNRNLAETSTGVNITFTRPTIYNTPASPETNNITEDLTDAKISVIQKIYHLHSAAPTFPAGWVKLGEGDYALNELNIIYAEWISGTRVEYWIIQES
jgi:hypothetical protein